MAKKSVKIENKKYFKLPKEFAEKWIAELRSGNYTQHEGSLVKSNKDDLGWGDEDLEVDFKCACCLGVAAVMLAGEDKKLVEADIPRELGSYLRNLKYPEELIQENSDFDSLDNILSSLNDGYQHNNFILQKRKKKYPNIKFKEEEGTNQYSFNEIADFIEEYVEFY